MKEVFEFSSWLTITLQNNIQEILYSILCTRYWFFLNKCLFQGGFHAAVLCSFVGGFLCGVCFVIAYASPLLLSVCRKVVLRDCGISWVSSSDQSLRSLHEETLHHWLSKMRTVKILI